MKFHDVIIITFNPKYIPFCPTFCHPRELFVLSDLSQYICTYTINIQVKAQLVLESSILDLYLSRN